MFSPDHAWNTHDPRQWQKKQVIDDRSYPRHREAQGPSRIRVSNCLRRNLADDLFDVTNRCRLGDRCFIDFDLILIFQRAQQLNAPE